MNAWGRRRATHVLLFVVRFKKNLLVMLQYVEIKHVLRCEPVMEKSRQEVRFNFVRKHVLVAHLLEYLVNIIKQEVKFFDLRWQLDHKSDERLQIAI